jgi:hypothetical protein
MNRVRIARLIDGDAAVDEKRSISLTVRRVGVPIENSYSTVWELDVSELEAVLGL